MSSLIEQLEYIRSFLLDERRKGKASVGAAKARARVAKQENKARRLLKKGGRVKDIEVSKEFLKHSTERGEGSQGEGGKVSQTRDIVRQLKHTAHKHKKGQVAATSKHPRRIGSELVRKRSEIPPEDIVKTSTVTKPDRGKDIDVTRVHTDKPESHYSTKKMTSIVYKKDPKFMEPRGRREGGRDYRKRTRGHMAVTSFPGRTAPPAPQWAKSGHVAIEPRRQAEQLEDIKYFLEGETTGADPEKTGQRISTAVQARVQAMRDLESGKRKVFPYPWHKKSKQRASGHLRLTSHPATFDPTELPKRLRRILRKVSVKHNKGKWEKHGKDWDMGAAKGGFMKGYTERPEEKVK